MSQRMLSVECCICGKLAYMFIDDPVLDDDAETLSEWSAIITQTSLYLCSKACQSKYVDEECGGELF